MTEYFLPLASFLWRTILTGVEFDISSSCTANGIVSN